MMNFLYLFISFFLLLYARQILINLLVKISFILTKGPNLAKTIYFLLLFPGVIVHELAHFFVASFLLVPTGEITLFPEEKRMGSIQVAKTDPVREVIIGMAPTIIGTAAILAVFLIPLNLPSKIIGPREIFSLIKNSKNLIWLYLIFSINNTMFSSESDRRSWLGLLVFAAMLTVSLYFFGVLHLVSGPLLYYGQLAARLISLAYTSTFLVNFVFIIPFFVFQKLIEKLK